VGVLGFSNYSCRIRDRPIRGTFLGWGIKMSSMHENMENSSPAQFLEDNILLLPKGKALDVAMGSGRNSIFLARNGFDVEGVDVSEEAVNNAQQSARKYGVIIHTSVADLENNYLIKANYYDTIICFNYLQRSLISQIKTGLKMGGMIVYETFTIDQPRFGKPRNPDFLLHYNELLEMFRDFLCLRYREGIFENKAIASLLAQKVK
jgi:tellurite methyltransferase